MFKINEANRPREIEQGADYFMKKYPRQMKLIESSPLSRCRPHGITEIDVVSLGQQLQQWEDYVRYCESVGTMADLGTIPNIALDVLGVNFAQSPVNVICTTQTLEDEQGFVSFKDIVAQNTRGNVTTGQDIISTLAMPAAFPVGYASDTFRNATVLSDSSSSTSITAVALAGAADFGSPINPQTISFSGTFVTGSGTAVFSNVAVNPANGAFSAAAEEGTSGAYLTLVGVVNLSAGTVTASLISSDSAAISSRLLTSTFQTLEEGNVDVQRIQLKIQTKPVLARFMALGSNIGLGEAYLMQKRYGMSGEEELARNLTAGINLEIVNTVVQTLVANVPSSPTNVTWQREAPPGVSYYEHVMTLKNALADSSAQILKRAGRGAVNCWVVGLSAGTILSTLPGFTKLSDDASFGAHIFGTLDGVTIVRVPFSSILDDYTMIGVYKGSNPFEAAMAYLPFMPLVLTPTLPVAYNFLQSQKGAAVWAGIESIIPNFSTSLTINNTDPAFDYGNDGVTA